MHLNSNIQLILNIKILLNFGSYNPTYSVLCNSVVSIVSFMPSLLLPFLVWVWWVIICDVTMALVAWVVSVIQICARNFPWLFAKESIMGWDWSSWYWRLVQNVQPKSSAWGGGLWQTQHDVFGSGMELCNTRPLYSSHASKLNVKSSLKKASSPP